MKKYFIFFLFLKLFYAEDKNMHNWRLELGLNGIDNLKKDYFYSLIEYSNNDFDLIYTTNWENKNKENVGNLVELYKNNFYVFLGNSDVADSIAGIEYTMGSYTFGFKFNNYDSEDVFFYKLQKDWYLGEKDIFSIKLTGIDSEEDFKTFYMIKNQYKNIYITHYFDFDNTNQSVIEYKLKDKTKKINYSIGYSKDFKTRDDGFSLGISSKL
ncbi:MAG: hypothetical protein JXM74_00415 [Fusobacteriaceae bacterium]|nr:hypothetical protein [Fusobacteriaceae bacterium]